MNKAGAWFVLPNEWDRLTIEDPISYIWLWLYNILHHNQRTSNYLFFPSQFWICVVEATKLFQTLSLFKVPINQIIMSPENKSVAKLENQEDCMVSLLDLPEWTLDCILERLSPKDFCRVAQVCTCLRYRCRSDDLWEKQVKHKWGRLLGDVAYQEWQWHTTNINTQRLLLQQNQSGSCGSFSGVWPFLNFHSYLENFRDLSSLFRICSQMPLFICLETGRFWFPTQVYKVTTN